MTTESSPTTSSNEFVEENRTSSNKEEFKNNKNSKKVQFLILSLRKTIYN